MPHLLQIANVGQSVGGTAACAWTVTRSLPDWRHTTVFLSTIHAETRRVFGEVALEQWPRVTADRLAAVAPDIILLHNIATARVDLPLPAPTLQYLHSRISPANADRTVYCSRWLAGQYRAAADGVLYQAVPRPLYDPRFISGTRALRPNLVVGRICTPQPQKWPALLPDFYGRLATLFPTIRWEFVGCPPALQPALRTACRDQIKFHPASWDARRLFWEWDVLLYHNPAVTESFGRTVAESLRAGCIPIVDRRGGFIEQIAPDTGWLCESPDDFAAALEALHNAGTRRRRSRACRSHGDEQFSLARFGDRLKARFAVLRDPQPHLALSESG